MHLISREDYPNGHNLTEEQTEFKDQFARQGSPQIRLGRRRRKLLSLALVPLAVVNSHGRKSAVGTINELNERPFVPGPELAIISLADHPARYPNQWHFIESRVLVNIGYIDEGGAPCIGGVREMCRLRADFSKGPLMKGQQALQCDSSGDLLSPRNGKLRIARVGRWIDICVGRHANKQNTVVYRLEESVLSEDNPSATLAFELPNGLPGPGEVIELTEVQEKQVLVSHKRRFKFFQAMFENGEPLTQWPPGRVLPAARVEIFKILNDMNLEQNDATLLPTDQRQPLVDPDEWAFGAYVAFEQRTVTHPKHADESVVVDPMNLTTLPGFTPTQALKDDLLKAVGPH